MLKRFILYGILLCCIFPARLKAQYPNLVFNKLTIQEGLPEETIICLLQDKPGYIWMGTQAGVVRYDGYKTRFYNFGVENTYNAFTTIVFEDNSGKLWAGTNSDLFYYDRATDDFKSYVPPVDGNKISKTKGAIQYEIEDNGVGRKKSAELKSLFKKEHKSKGMELLSKRLKLLSKELGADIEANYEDVMNNSEVAGTLVTIKVLNNFSDMPVKTR